MLRADVRGGRFFVGMTSRVCLGWRLRLKGHTFALFRIFRDPRLVYLRVLPKNALIWRVHTLHTVTELLIGHKFATGCSCLARRRRSLSLYIHKYIHILIF